MKWKAKPIQFNENSFSVVGVCLVVHISISLFFQPTNAKKNISTEGNSRDFKYVVCNILTRELSATKCFPL